MKTFQEILAGKRAFGLSSKTFSFYEQESIDSILHRIDTSSVESILETHDELDRTDGDIRGVMGGRIKHSSLSPSQMTALYILWYRQGCRPYGYRGNPLGDGRFVFYKFEDQLLREPYNRDVTNLSDEDYDLRFRGKNVIRLRLKAGLITDYKSVLRDYVRDISKALLNCDPECKENMHDYRWGKIDYPEWFQNMDPYKNDVYDAIEYMKSSNIDFLKDSLEYDEQGLGEAISSLPDSSCYVEAYKHSLRARYQARASIRSGYKGEVRKDVAKRLLDMGLIEIVYLDHIRTTKKVDIYNLTNKGLRLVRSLFGMPNMALESRQKLIASRVNTITYIHQSDDYNDTQDRLWQESYRSGEMQEFAYQIGIETEQSLKKFFGDYRTLHNTQRFHDALREMLPDKYEVPVIRFRYFEDASSLTIWPSWQEPSRSFGTEIYWRKNGSSDDESKKLEVKHPNMDAYFEHAYEFDEYIEYLEVVRLALGLFESFCHDLIDVEMMEGL